MQKLVNKIMIVETSKNIFAKTVCASSNI